MTSNRLVLAGISAILACACACACACSSASAPRGGGPDWIRAPFKARAGDDPSWSLPSLDDHDWPPADATLMPGTSIADWSGIAWFRLWIEVPSERAGRPVPLYGRYVGAAEVFIDGVRQFAIGDPGALASGSSSETPVDFKAENPRWILFDRPGRHLIAVRFASLDVEAMHRIGFPAGFQLALSGAEPLAEVFSWLIRAGLIGSTIALALLHLLLFLFHRYRRENLHYALAVLCAAGIMASQQALWWATSTVQALAMLGLFGASISLSSVLLLRFYYDVFLPRLPRSYWPMFAIACALALSAWTTPRALYYGFAGLMCLEQARVLITAVLRRANGAWIIGVGGALWVAGGLIQMLGDLGAFRPVEDAYLYGFFALLGSISIYLARDIARAKERYRTIFETTGTGTIIFGDDAVISLANEEWAQLTGYARGEIEGRMTWREFFGELSLENAQHAYEAQLKDRSGKLHDGVVTINRVEGTNERVGSYLDLTDLKRAQRQMFRADKMAALGQIIAGVAHEINNPNNFIHFNLPILRKYVEAMRPQLEKDPDLKLLNMTCEAFLEDLSKLIENMEHGSQRITAIVSDLRSYIRSGEELEMTAGSPAKVIERAMALVGKQVKKMVKELRVSVAEDLPPVKMNSGKIEQVLINLLINAAQAADKELSWVALSARATDSGRAVEIAVEDNGTGIPAASLEQIFEPFYTTKGRETGTGLGLSISQQIVEEHHGRMTVTSELGRGSCFTVRLPAA